MNDGPHSVCEAAISRLNAAHLSLASGELDVHETAGVLEPLHGTALTTQLLALIQLQYSVQ